MSEDLVIQYCSPTLAGLKTGSLFSCPCPSEEEVRRDVRALNQVLVPKGLCVLPLRRVRLPQYGPVPGGAGPAAAAAGGVSP